MEKFNHLLLCIGKKKKRNGKWPELGFSCTSHTLCKHFWEKDVMGTAQMENIAPSFKQVLVGCWSQLTCVCVWAGGGGGGLCVKVCRKERTSVRSPCPHGVASNSLDREDGVGEWQRDRETSWPACSVQFSFLCPSLRLTLAQRFLSFKDATLAIIQGRHLKDGLQFPLTWSQISKDNTFYLPGMKCPPSPSIFSSVNQKLLLPDDREK